MVAKTWACGKCSIYMLKPCALQTQRYNSHCFSKPFQTFPQLLKHAGSINQVAMGAFSLRSPAIIQDRCLSFKERGKGVSWHCSFPSKGRDDRMEFTRVFTLTPAPLPMVLRNPSRISSPKMLFLIERHVNPIAVSLVSDDGGIR